MGTNVKNSVDDHGGLAKLGTGYSISKKEEEVMSGVDPDDPYFQFAKPPAAYKGRANSIEEADTDQEDDKSGGNRSRDDSIENFIGIANNSKGAANESPEVELELEDSLGDSGRKSAK